MPNQLSRALAAALLLVGLTLTGVSAGGWATITALRAYFAVRFIVYVPPYAVSQGNSPVLEVNCNSEPHNFPKFPMRPSLRFKPMLGKLPASLISVINLDYP